MIKKLMLAICCVAAFAVTGYAGSDAKDYRSVQQTTSYYSAGERTFSFWGGDATRDIRNDNRPAYGVDGKYFLNRNLGIGVEGYYRARQDHTGAALATVTLRQPMGRFAPYVFGGVGGSFPNLDSSRAGLAGQGGAGIEARVTRHAGIFTDYSYNMNEGAHNDFHLVRGGINLSF